MMHLILTGILFLFNRNFVRYNRTTINAQQYFYELHSGAISSANCKTRS